MRVTVHATSNADDAAYRSLADVARLAAGRDDIRVIGGHMVALLVHAFGAADAATRRTNDTDAAISTDVAASGSVHAALEALDYRATSGNAYRKGDREINLLVPSTDGGFRTVEHGGRGFDAAPGLLLALAVPPVVLDVEVVHQDRSRDRFDVLLPTLEAAVVLKTLATVTRQEARDLTDIHSLLEVAYIGDASTWGGWTLNRTSHTGARLDAARRLNQLADGARHNRQLDQAEVPAHRFTALVRALVRAGT